MAENNHYLSLSIILIPQKLLDFYVKTFVYYMYKPKNNTMNETQEQEQEVKKQKKEIEVELSDEQKDQILEDLVFSGYAEKEVDLLNGKVKVKFKSISGDEQLKVEEKMEEIKGSAAYVLHKYTIRLIAASVTKFKDTDLSEMPFEQKVEFISNLATPVIDALARKHNQFVKEVQAAVNGEAIESFFGDRTIDLE